MAALMTAARSVASALFSGKIFIELEAVGSRSSFLMSASISSKSRGCARTMTEFVRESEVTSTFAPRFFRSS